MNDLAPRRTDHEFIEEEPVSSSVPEPEAFDRLLEALQQQWMAAGRPSFRTIESRLRERNIAPVSHTTVDRYIKGENVPKLGALLEIVAALHGDRAKFRLLWEAMYKPTEQRVERGDCVGRLESPEPGTTVGSPFRVDGVVRALPTRHHAWLALQIDPGGLIWPKDYEVIPDGDGHFERHVHEGGSSRELFVLLMLTSEAGHAQLDSWMKEGSRSGHYPGIPPSRTTLLELDRVSVRLDSSA
jgi:hypothetical protein